jgi:3-methyladenine DNA glycosylase AlkD
MLATILDDPALVTPAQALEWASDSDSWDITDGLCLNLLDKTPFAYDLPAQWAGSEHEFVKRAAFALIAGLAWHDKLGPDEPFVAFLGLVRREAHDPRNFVKKAVNWALRHIGKRSAALHPQALALAEELAASDDRTERWVGRDAARELASEKVLRSRRLR